ncbi:MAG TPA: hypothetical protein G4O18_07695 [Dehalococcoidia bacterium]|nr:hypothetical protein [Dehalococcoidia bacterium]
MRLLDKIKARLKDRTRRRLSTDLRAIGLNAQTMERGQPEEGISGGLMGASLGLIAIQNSPIKWINLLEHPASRYASATFTNVYVVPDSRVRSGGYLELRSARRRTASVYGRVIDIDWTANFVGTRVVVNPDEEWDEDMEERLLDRINNDTTLKTNLIRLNEDITVRSVPNFWCWAISSGSYQESGYSYEHKKLAPSREQWDCFEVIAWHLVEASAAGKPSKDKDSEAEESHEASPVSNEEPPETESPEEPSEQNS